MSSNNVDIEITVKIERECEVSDAACDEAQARVSLSSYCSDEEVRVKQEPADLAAACDPVEELYAGHEVKEEMVIGPVVLQYAPLVITQASIKQPDEKPILPNSKQYIVTVSTRHRKVREESLSSNASLQFTCDTCQKSFKNKSDLKRHIHWHTEKKYPCIYCKKKFKRLYDLNRHMNTHSFSCDICKKLFKNKIDFNSHECIEEKPIMCEFCGKQFSFKNNLIRHKLLHTREKRFSCDICKRRFYRKEHLNLHKLCHTGEKPYSCNICARKLTKKQYLIKHEEIHTGKQLKYQCDICNKLLSSKYNLKVHQRVHTKKLFPCDICHAGFKRQEYLITHQKRFHNTE